MADAASIPIRIWKVLGGGAQSPQIRRFPEDAGETFKLGTPVTLDSDGNLIESPALTSALTIAGFSTEPGANLTTDATPKTLTYGSVVNQSNAVLIPGGAPPNDGKSGVLIADDKSIFVGKALDAHTTIQSDVGKIYGLTKATNGFWYIDTGITAAASGAIAEIIETVGTLKAGGLLAFRITQAGQLFGT